MSRQGGKHPGANLVHVRGGDPTHPVVRRMRPQRGPRVQVASEAERRLQLADDTLPPVGPAHPLTRITQAATTASSLIRWTMAPPPAC